MNEPKLPENMLQLLDIADEVGLDDYQPLFDAFEAAQNRILKCGNDAAWRLLVHDRPPEHLPEEQRDQLTLDARFMHHMVKAVNVRAWRQTIGAQLHSSPQQDTPRILTEAWKAINGETEYGPQFDGKPPMRRWLKESFAKIMSPKSLAVQELLNAAPSLEAA